MRNYADPKSGYNLRSCNGLVVGLSAMGKKKPTVDDIEARIEEVVVMLSKGMRTGKIKRLIGNRYLVKYRQINIYITRARARIYARRDSPRNEIQADSLAFYELVASGGISNSSVRDRLLARKRVDELLGLDEPKQIELSGRVDTDSEMRELMVKATLDKATSEDARRLAEKLAGIDPEGGARLQNDNGNGSG